MNKEDAEKLVNAYKFLYGAYASYSNSIMQYEQSDKNVSLSDWRKYKAYKLGYKKLHQRIISHMAPEPVVITLEEVKLLISLVPEWAEIVPRGLCPTLYGTLSYKGDLAVKNRVAKIIEKVKQLDLEDTNE